MSSTETEEAFDRPKLVMDYTPDEAHLLLLQYQQLLDKSERRLRRVPLLLTVATVCCVSSLFLPQPAAVAAVILALSLYCFIIFWLRAYRLPQCSACAGRVDGTIGVFCPECGGETVANPKRGILQCEFCRKSLIAGENRRYKIRRCTYCGVKLDAEGL